MPSRRPIDIVYRDRATFVRALLSRFKKRLQPADLADIEQTVWLNLATRASDGGAIDNDEAYLTTVVKNAVVDFYKKKRRKKRDDRRNVRLVVDDTSGPIDVGMVDACDVTDDVERQRTKERVHAIALHLAPSDRAAFDRMMIDYESVPKKERDRVFAAVRKLMLLSPKPRADDLDEIEGPSHCGRTLRRLDLDRDDAERVDDDRLDAAE